jgi:ADP-heptose:LPS heptosyltransferase
VSVIGQIRSIFGYHFSHNLTKQDFYKAETFLLFRPGWMGDLAHMSGLLRVLSQHHKTVDIAVLGPGYALAQYYQKRGLVRSIYRLDRMSHYFSLLKDKYDVCIDAEQSFYFCSLLWIFSSTPVRIGFDTNNRRLLYTHIVWYRQEIFEAQSFLSLLSPFGIEEKYALESIVDDGELFSDPVWIDIPTDARVLVIHTGAAIDERRWPIESWIDLLRKIGQSFDMIVSVGLRNVSVDEEQILAAGVPHFFALGWKTTLPQTLAIIKRSKLLISNDTWVLHLSLLTDTPAIGIFGPGIAKKWSGHTITPVFRTDLSCIGCNYGRFSQTPYCPIDLVCIKKLEVTKVVLTVNSVLKSLWVK